MKCYSRALHEGGRLPVRITNYEEQIFNRSPRQRKQPTRLLQEVLLLTAENSSDSGEEILFSTANFTVIYL